MKNSARYLTRGALIAALYVALTYISSLFGLSSGAIQIRLSESLTLLPLFMSEAVPGLFIGCFISNLLFGGSILDIFIGSAATLIGAIGTRVFLKISNGLKWMACIPTVLINTLAVPFIIAFSYGSDASYPILMLTVFIGEVISSGIVGSLLYYSLKRAKFDRYLK